MKPFTFADYFPTRRERVIARACFLLVAVLGAFLFAASLETTYAFALGLMLLVILAYERWVLPMVFLLVVGRP